MPDDIPDLLESQKGNRITIKLRSGKIVSGVLRDFDVHMTMKLESAEEYVGGLTGTTSNNDDDTTTTALSDNTDNTSQASRTHIGSVLLRGDNILLISIPDDGDDDDDDDTSSNNNHNSN